MGKVKDEAAAARATKPAKAGPARKGPGVVGAFLANLVDTRTYKVSQGRQARIWTAVGLGLLAGAGVYQFHEQFIRGESTPLVSVLVPSTLVLAFAWLIFRTVQYPPFVDFLVATEAEMNKVSWTSRDDLYRATMVVLVTVLFLSLYLFGVDWIWSQFLQFIGVLRFSSGGFGSQAG